MKHWTKIRRDVVRSTRLAALLEHSPLGYALYMNAKAVSDDYGRLPADPRVFKGQAAPMSHLSLQRIAAALDAMEEHQVIRRYQANDDGYLEILSYNDVEGTDWQSVGQPEYPAPEDWQPPQSLLETIRKQGTTDWRITPERYGLTEEQVPGYRRPTERTGLGTFPRRSPDGPPTSRSTVARRSRAHAEAEAEAKAEAEAEAVDVKDVGAKVKGGTTLSAKADESPPDPVRELTPTQKAIQNAWEAFGQTGIATDPPQSKPRRYSGLVRLVQEHGIPVVEEWCAWLRTHPETVPEGSPPWPYFCTRFKQAMAAPSGVGWRKTDPDLFSGPVTAKRIANAPEPDREKFRSAAEGPKPTSGNLGSP